MKEPTIHGEYAEHSDAPAYYKITGDVSKLQPLIDSLPKDTWAVTYAASKFFDAGLDVEFFDYESNPVADLGDYDDRWCVSFLKVSTIGRMTLNYTAKFHDTMMSIEL